MSVPRRSLGPKVFISYARADGADYARALRKRLHAERPDITLWQDVTNEHAGYDWWLQVTEALDHVDHMILVMTRGALESDTVRKEWRYARQRGVCIIPVQVAPALDLSSAPRWMRTKHVADLSVSEQWALFLSDLTAPREQARVPFMADDLPDDFVHRSALVEHLISLLLDEAREKPSPVTAGLYGPGGYGKTTIARAVSHDDRIQEAFDDGVLWVTLGEQPGDLTAKLVDLIEVLSGERPGFHGQEAAIGRLKELLADRDILMVVDDVWNTAHVAPFLQGGARCARIITTRNLDTLPVGTARVRVEAMDDDEAAHVLRVGLPSGEESGLRQLAARLGRWPLLLKLANGVLRERLASDDQKQPLAQALAFVRADLDENGLTAFDADDPVARDQAVAATVAASLKQLGEMQRPFEELAIFPPQVDVPLETVAQLWRATAQLSPVNSEKLCQRLHNLSLLARFDLYTRRIRIHDVMRTFLRGRLTGLAATHAALTSAWGDPLHLPDDYAWRWIAYHLAEGGHANQLRGLLLDFNWLRVKLAKAGITSLIADYDYLLPPLHSLQRTLRLSAHVLATDTSQLAGQLLGRIDPHHASECQAVLDAAKRWKDVPWLRPLKPTLTGDGGPLLQTLAPRERAERLVAVYQTQGGWRALSASRNVNVVNSLKIWDLRRGELVRVLAGDIGPVNAVKVYRDERGWRAVSASWDGYGKNGLRLWDIEEENPRPNWLADPGHVDAMAIAEPLGQCVVASLNGRLGLWDLKTGELRNLEKHEYDINGVAVYDGKTGTQVACACQDKNLRVWNIDLESDARVFTGHTAAVNAVEVFKSSGRWLAVSASRDKTLRLWDLDRARAVRTLRGHIGAVNAVAVYQTDSESWRAVSASDDHTLKIWDLRSGRELQTLRGHGDLVGGVAVYKETEGWRAVSVSDDGTLKVWDLETEARRSATRAAVTSVAVYGDRTGCCAFTGSENGSVSVCDSERTEARNMRVAHRGAVNAVAVFRRKNSWFGLSASSDKTLRVWDLGRGKTVRTLRGHSSAVRAVSAYQEAGRWRAVSASDDDKRVTLKLWDLERNTAPKTLNRLRSAFGQEEFTVYVHRGRDGFVRAAASYAHKQGPRAVMSHARPGIVDVWDLTRGKVLRTISAHVDEVVAVAVYERTRGWRLVCGSLDSTMTIWNLDTGTEELRLKGHARGITGVAVASISGKWLALSSSWDGTVKAWSVETGEVVATFTADAPLQCCAVAGDGKTFVAGDERGRVHFLELQGL